MTITVSSGVTSSGLTISSGDPLIVLSGGKVESSTILSGGSATLSSGAGGGGLYIASGGVLQGDGGLKADLGETTQVYGSVSGVTVSHAELLELSDRAVGDDLKIVSGGEIYVISLSSASDSVISDGDIWVNAGYSGTAVTVDTQLKSGGFEGLIKGGKSIRTTISSGGLESVGGGGAGMAISTTVLNGGGLFLSVGGVASVTTVSNGGALILVGGSASRATVLSGGALDFGSNVTGVVVAREVMSTTVVSGVTVSSGGGLDLSGCAVLSGGAEVISSGGVADFTALSGGKADIDAGGLAGDTTVASGGVANVYGLASGTTVESGQEIVRSGGVASGTAVLSGGLEYIVSGGTTSGLELFSGGLVIGDGKVRYTGSGTLAGTLEGSGSIVESTSGVLLISGSGAAFDGQVAIEGGTIELATSGAIGTGYIQFVARATGSAVLQIDAADAPAAGGTFANRIEDFSGANEDIDLRSISFVSGASATVSGGVLALSDGGKTYKFDLGGTIAAAYSVLSDGHGGTLIDPAALAFSHAAAAFAPLDAATALASSTSPGAQTPFLHATASAGAGRA